MTHTQSHIIISLTTPVEVAKVKTRGGIAAGVLLLIGVAIGWLVF